MQELSICPRKIERVDASQKQNFLRDQSGMKKQLSTLQQLLQVMDPELYRHLEKTEGLNLFFCFRSVPSYCGVLPLLTRPRASWILIAFKREFSFEDVLRLWEVLWTDYYTNGMVLFVALAVLESHRDVILRYLVEFDEILKVTSSPVFSSFSSKFDRRFIFLDWRGCIMCSTATN